jgi:hypothetical protein
MIRIAKDVVKDQPLATGVKWEDVGDGFSVLDLGNGKYLSQNANGTFSHSPNKGKWEQAKLSGQICSFKSDLTQTQEVVFMYTWAETP